MDGIEIPEYFVCPISLQIMKDPVTAITGITYDRESIEKWLQTAKETTCPVTNQPLPKHSDLTPNLTLRRLIQAWCTANATKGIDRIPTPKPPLDKTQVFKLVKDLRSSSSYIDTLRKMEALAMENERNKKCMEEAGVGNAMVWLICRCFKEGRTLGLEEALRILHLTWTPSNEIRALISEDHNDFFDALTWVLGCEVDNHLVVKAQAAIAMKMVMEVASGRLMESFKIGFFKQIIKLLTEKVSQQATKSALQVLIQVCPRGRNRMKIVEANGVFELIELELAKPEKKITELIFNLLGHLCSCAEGRAKFLGHAGAIAMVSKRILRVSPATDDRGVHILSLISKFSATSEVLSEMLRVGAVTKLCMVIQADCAAYLKGDARAVLRLHSKVWNNSPCIAVYLLTRYQR